jgi:hypothetical protein
MMLLAGNFGKGPGRETGFGPPWVTGPAAGNNGGMTERWAESKTPVGPPTSASPTVRQLLYAALVTGAWAGLLSLVVYLIGRLFGVPFDVTRGLESVVTVSWLGVLLIPLVMAVIGALLASLARGLPHAGRLVFWIGTVVALGSCWFPMNQPAAVGWSTRILLVVMHVITWLLVVPQIARIVGDSEPGAHVDRGE